MDNIRIIKGAGIYSVQVYTKPLQGRPFPAFAVLCDIKEDGSIIHWKGDKDFRKEVLKNLMEVK